MASKVPVGKTQAYAPPLLFTEAFRYALESKIGESPRTPDSLWKYFQKIGVWSQDLFQPLNLNMKCHALKEKMNYTCYYINGIGAHNVSTSSWDPTFSYSSRSGGIRPLSQERKCDYSKNVQIRIELIQLHIPVKHNLLCKRLHTGFWLKNGVLESSENPLGFLSFIRTFDNEDCIRD